MARGKDFEPQIRELFGVDLDRKPRKTSVGYTLVIPGEITEDRKGKKPKTTPVVTVYAIEGKPPPKDDPLRFQIPDTARILTGPLVVKRGLGIRPFFAEVAAGTEVLRNARHNEQIAEFSASRQEKREQRNAKRTQRAGK